MGQYLLDDGRVFNAGDNLHWPLTLVTFGDIDTKDTLKPSCPGHGGMFLHGRAFIGFDGVVLLCSLAPFGRGNGDSVLTVEGKDTVETGQVNPRFGYQSSKPGDKIQGLKNHMRSAIAVRRFELITHPAIFGQGQALFRVRACTTELSQTGQIHICEADPVRLARVRSVESDSVYLIDKMRDTLGGEITAIHVGKLYDAVITTLAELKEVGDLNLDFNAWFQEIGDVKAEGEFGHFQFFHSLYEVSHPLIEDTPDIWSLPASDPRYPSYDVPVNPTAYDGRPTSIEDTDLKALAWLGNMNYWSMLLLLDSAYRSSSAPEVTLAQTIMMGPLNSIARYLPTRGSAVPFDPLSLGFNPGLNAAANKRVTHLMLQETRDFARSIENLLPADFNIEIYDQLLNEV